MLHANGLLISCVEQLAGDLCWSDGRAELPAANCNHSINSRRAIPVHTAYIVDRVNTTATVFLGLTLGCAQCHDHKYDPITQKEFYRLFAFFHNIPENGLDGSKGNAAPLLRSPSAAQQKRLDEIAKKVTDLEKRRWRPERSTRRNHPGKAALNDRSTAMVMREIDRDPFVWRGR